MKRATITVLAALALASVAAVSAASAQTKGGTLVVALEVEPAGFDSLGGLNVGEVYGTLAWTIMEQTQNRDPETDEPVSVLATSIEVSEDGKTIVTKLRPGIRFHDGTPLNAEAVAAHQNRIHNPDNKSVYRSFITPILKSEAIDELTVRTELQHVWLPATRNYGVPWMYSLVGSPKAVADGTQGRHPIGTGPFRFVEWRSGDRIIVERNPDYWNADAIHLDRIVFRFIPDHTTRYAALESGEVDVIWTDRGESIEKAERDPEIEVLNKDSAGGYITQLNATKPPFDDIRVRQAVRHAIDQSIINTHVFDGRRTVIDHPFGPRVECDAAPLAYDPEKAKALLADYGKPVSFTYTVTATTRGRVLGEVIQQLLKRVGIHVELRALDTNAFVVKGLTRDFDMIGWSIAGTVDIGPQFFPLTFSKSPYNMTGLADPAIDEAGLAMRTAKTIDERDSHACQLAREVNKQAALQFNTGHRYYVLHRSNVKNVTVSELGAARVWDAWKE